MSRVRFGAAARIGLGVILLVALLFIGVFPTRTYMRQRESIAGTEEQLTVLRSANEKLAEEVKRLKDTEAVERIAREQYNLVFPGEEGYALLPAPPAPPPVPDTWPFRGLHRALLESAP